MAPRVRRMVVIDNVMPVAMAPAETFRETEESEVIAGSEQGQVSDAPKTFVPSRVGTRQIVCDNVAEVTETLVERPVSRPYQDRPVRTQKQSSAHVTIGDAVKGQLAGFKPEFLNKEDRDRAEDAAYMANACRIASHRVIPVRTIENDEVVAMITPRFGEPLLYVRSREEPAVVFRRYGKSSSARKAGFRHVFEADAKVAVVKRDAVVHCTKDGMIREKTIQPTVDILWFQSAEIPDYKKQIVPVLEPGTAPPVRSGPTKLVRLLGWCLDRIVHLHPDRVEEIEEALDAFLGRLISMNIEEYTYNERRRLGLPSETEGDTRHATEIATEGTEPTLDA